MKEAVGLFEGTVCPHVLGRSCVHAEIQKGRLFLKAASQRHSGGVPCKLVKVSPLWYHWLRKALLHLLLGPLLL